MRNIFYTFAVLVLLVVGFFAFNNYIYEQKQGDGLNLVPDLKDSVFLLSGEMVTLVNGVSEDGSIRYFGNEASGDISGDGIDDIVALITETLSTTTTRFHLVGGISKKGLFEVTQAVMVGDNLALQGVGIIDTGLVSINYGIQEGVNSIKNPTTGKTTLLRFNPLDLSWGEVVSDFEGEADPSVMTLTMKPWTWVSARRGDDALIAPRNPDRFVLTFKTDGSFSATTDCNTMGGSYTASGTALVFGQMFSTKMFCEDSQEQIFADVLRDVESYKFTGKGELVMGVKVKGEAVFK